MPKAARDTDFAFVLHSCSATTGIIEGSPNVYFNQYGSHRLTDHNESHIAPVPECDSNHSTTLNIASPNVFVNNLGAGRVGDTYTCDAEILLGSPNIHING